MNQDCPFCAISSEPPSSRRGGTTASQGERILKEGEHMYVIFSNPRLMPGHLLVISKRHIQKLSEMTKEEKRELLDLLIEFEEKILEKLSTGCDIRQHFKPYVQNNRTSVKHFHFHLQPRELDDAMHKVIDPPYKPLYQDLPDEERERLFKLLSE